MGAAARVDKRRIRTRRRQAEDSDDQGRSLQRRRLAHRPAHLTRSPPPAQRRADVPTTQEIQMDTAEKTRRRRKSDDEMERGEAPDTVEREEGGDADEHEDGAFDGQGVLID